MSDTPASWQPDPTGRHDHRYWDGTQWTDHVADAGVAGTDPYDGPAPADDGGAGAAGTDAEAAGAAPTWSGGSADDAPAETPVATADETTADTEADATDVAAPAASTVSAGWGAPAEPEPEPPADEAPGEAPATTSGWARPDEPAPAVSTWSSPSPTGWSATGAGAGTGAEDETAVGEAADDVTAATPTSSWSDTTTTWSTTAPPVADDEGAPPPTGTVPPEDRGARGKVLLLLLALLVIVGVIVALVVTSDDDDDGDAGAIADRISATLQEDLDMESGPADCIGEHIVDEIGAARLQDVDFDAEEAPADLEDDFNSAFEDAIGACDLSPSDLGSADGGDDGGDEGDDASGDVGFDDPEQFAALLTESYQSTLGLPEDKAACLAEQMVDAVASGELSEDQAFGEFFQYLDSCQISLEELNPTTVPG